MGCKGEALAECLHQGLRALQIGVKCCSGDACFGLFGPSFCRFADWMQHIVHGAMDADVPFCM